MFKKSLAIVMTLSVSYTMLYASWENRTLQFEGRNRSYRIYLPVNYSSSETYSLVLGIHGLGDNMTGFGNAFADFCRIADTANIILVYPQGLDNPIIGTGWNAGAGMLGIYPSENADDIGFINTVTDIIQQEYPINKAQTYLFGFSNGGFMVQRIACESNERYAAVASIAGTLGNKINYCNPARQIPIVHFHGTADINVNYYNPPFGRSVSALMGLWSANFGCDTERERVKLPDIKPDGYTVEHYVYKNCSQRLELFKVNDAMHVLLHKAANDISYSEEIWRFFTYQKDTSVPTAIRQQVQTQIKVYPVPAAETVRIELQGVQNHRDFELSVWDYTGKKITVLPHNPAGNYIFDCRNLPDGIYLVNATDGNRLLCTRFTIAK